MLEDLEFKDLLKYIRASKNMSLRSFGSELDFTTTYLFDLEKGNRLPTKNVVDRIINNLDLDEELERIVYDSSANACNTVPYDVQEYLMGNKDAIKRVREEMKNSKKNIKTK